jgi:DNA-binding transcriptional LysR family regulator
MKLTQLDGMLAFVAVAQTRSFTAAAATLEVTPPAVSQAVKQLEDRIGVRLFHRTTRSVSLTEAGERFHARVGPALSELTEAAAELDSYRDGPTGTLRINVPKIAWEVLLQPIVAGFLEIHPGIRLEVRLDDGFIDIVAAGFDAGVRIGESVQRDMVATVLTQKERICLVASPDYVAKHGAPKNIEALREHACIRFRFSGSGGIYRWELQQSGKMIEVEVDGPFTTSDSVSMAEAARAGIGIAYVFERQVKDDLASGRLIPVLPQCWHTYEGFRLYYPSRRQMPTKLRAFIDYCHAHIRERKTP